MAKKSFRSVLVVDDETAMCNVLKDRFMDCNDRETHPFAFDVDVALSAAQGIDKIRAKGLDGSCYDVIVLDIRMEEVQSGLKIAWRLRMQLGFENVVQIIFTGYPSYATCVQALRYGAWDYILKEDIGNTPATQIVVDSAVTRLRELELGRKLERDIAGDWLPLHFWEIQLEYKGQVVAIWHQPEIKVIASGVDVFELEAKLEKWRQEHAAWEQPFIVQVPH